MSVLVTNEEGKILYAICAERSNRRGQVLPTILHVHASNEGEARWIFGQDADHRKFRIIAVAPVIGFHVADNHGDVLIA